MKRKNLELFQERAKSLIYYIRGTAKYSQDDKEALIQIYQREVSEDAKKEMILSLYRILLTECHRNSREVHAIAAITMDNLLAGTPIKK